MATVQGLDITRAAVQTSLHAYRQQRLTGLLGAGADPRMGGPNQHIRSHMLWVHQLPDDVVYTRENAPRYLKLCLPFRQLQCYARYRLGGQHLAGRQHSSSGRTCHLCGAGSSVGRVIWQQRLLARNGNSQEDLPHFILECPAYDHIREHFASIFAGQANLSVAERLAVVFDHEEQSILVQCICHMDTYRNHLLGLTFSRLSRVYHQRMLFVPSDPSLQYASDLPPPSVRWLAMLLLGLIAVLFGACACCLYLLHCVGH